MPIGKEKNLPKSRFFICKNLIPMNSKIVSVCLELRRGGFLRNVYTVNGTVHISWARVEKKVMKIFHELMLHDLFLECDFSRFSSA